MRTKRRAVTKRAPARRGVLKARDLMTRDPVTVPQDMTLGDLCDVLQSHNINGAPVVDPQGYLVGVVTQEDIIYGAMGHPTAAEGAPEDSGRPSGRRVMRILRERRLKVAPPPPPRPGERPFWSDQHRPPDPMETPISAVMTSPAISAEEDTPVTDLCRIMWNLRIHRVPIVRRGRVTGLVSSMDVCRAILDGKIRI